MNILIEKYQLKVFFDEYELSNHLYGTLAEAISDSSVFIPVITSAYNEKLASHDNRDYCFYEFQYAHSHHGGHVMIPLIIESTVTKQSSWCSYLQAVCGSYLFVDISQEISKVRISINEGLNEILSNQFCSNPDNLQKFDQLVNRIKEIMIATANSSSAPSVSHPSSTSTSVSLPAPCRSASSGDQQRSLMTRIISLLGASLPSFPTFRDNSHTEMVGSLSSNRL